MNLLGFSLGELLLGQIQDFIYYLTQRYIGTIVGHVYLACIQRSNVSTRFHHYPIISQSLSHLSLKMLFLFFLYYLLQGPSIDAGPIPTIENRSLAGNHCNNLTHCRTIWNIVWSCLVTIFSCTWVAVHPNVPCPRKRKTNLWIERCVWNPLLSFAEHRLPLFICALLVPEYVLAWAIRQFLRAREIAHDKKGEFNLGLYFYQVISKLLLGRQWSMTHGFFMIMGGFHLFERCSEETSNDDRSISREDDKPLYPLQASDLVQCDRYSESFIMPTEAEIRDKGKSDWLAKSLVLLQTSWFVHCTGNRSPSSHPSRNRDACVCGHELCDIYFLVEQAPQRQSAYSSVPKIGVKGCAAPGCRTYLRIDLGNAIYVDCKW